MQNSRTRYAAVLCMTILFSLGALAQQPVINVWYGANQSFGKLGTPQRWVNILGNASHPNGINSLTYRLNGGPPRSLSVGPDSARLNAAGDFNIDLSYAELSPGANSVEIDAIANGGAFANTTVTVQNVSGSFWPLPYTVNWPSLSSLTDSAQVIDGRWGRDAAGVYPMEIGYDRLLAIGDTTWDDYEVTAEVTIHGYDNISFGPLVGFILRWKGHTDDPFVTMQPKAGYEPLGGFACFHWTTSGQSQWELYGNNLSLKDHTTIVQAPDNEQLYYFKMQVKTNPGQGGLYRFKVWSGSESEPVSWLLSGQETLSDPQRGSLLLVAHHVSVTFGRITVTPVSNGIPPAISNIQSLTGTTTANISWNTDLPATSVVRYGLTSSYTDSVVSGQVALSHDIQLQGLLPNTQYHYKIVAADWGGDVGTSNDLTFLTQNLPPPGTPSLLTPANNATNQATSLKLTWTRPATATSFRLQVSTDPNFLTGFFVDDASLADTARTVSGLSNGTEYYWRVSASNPGGSSSFSSARAFTTLMPAPVQVFPANNTAGHPTSLTLRWRAVQSTTAYHLQVATDSSFTGGLFLDDTGLTDTTRTVNGMAMSTRYYWRVNAKTATVTSAYSPIWVYSTLLPAPQLASPANNSTGQPLNILLRWRNVPGAATYRLQLGTDSTFVSGIIKNDSTIVDTFRLVGGLAASARLFWRVNAKNAVTTSAFSSVWNFRTDGQIQQVILIAPPSPTEIGDDTVQCVWQQGGPGVTRYWFEISIDSLFQSFDSIDSTVTDTTKIARQLLHNHTYWWRVRAGDPDAWGPFSEIRKFKIITTDIAQTNKLPNSFDLRQNYPNPFNPSTSIEFALPAQSRVKLEIYNLLGERIALLVDEVKSAGRYSVQFDAGMIPSGVYFYTLSTTSGAITKRMILVK